MSNLKQLIDDNFLEYANYVVKDRAIPDIKDGLKPVQRRVLYSMFRLDDGRFNKVANIVGHTMQFHPHGDASIGDALVGQPRLPYGQRSCDGKRMRRSCNGSDNEISSGSK